ncbi:Phosphatidylinositol 4-kinase stt4 [Cryptotrichosporon argae]
MDCLDEPLHAQILAALQALPADPPAESSSQADADLKAELAGAVSRIRKKEKPLSIEEIRKSLQRASAALVGATRMDSDILHYLVEIPMSAFTPLSIAAGVDAWTALLRQRPEAEIAVIGEISAGWLETIRIGRGMFNTVLNYRDPFVSTIQYAPSDHKAMEHELGRATRLLTPHLLLVQFLSAQFHASKTREPGVMVSLIRLIMRSLIAHQKTSTNPHAREVRFSLLLFGFQVLASSRLEALVELRFRDRLFTAAFAWFAIRPQWSTGSDRHQVAEEVKVLQEFIAAVQDDHIRVNRTTSSISDRAPAWPIRGSASLHDYATQHRDRVRLLQLLVENEVSRLNVWANPTNESGRTYAASGPIERTVGADEWVALVRRAWRASPAMAVHMGERFKQNQVQIELMKLVRTEPRRVLEVEDAVRYLLGEKLEAGARPALKYLPIWAPVPPVTALKYFHPRYGNHPLILQYAMRVLEQHPVDLTFFFVPQVVQALRADALGYVERFIFETSKISQLFCHQIIWNMKANTYRDDDGTEPDPMKPMLDRMIDMIVAALSGKAKAFYDKEFEFFASVTSISGKLKPYIKKTKPEKKAKIDEEMALIQVPVGVYLPSNPDGIVIDLDRKSGRPLQSHAKAPFMATFKVQKERIDLPSDAPVDIGDEAAAEKVKYEIWQSAIFKVGDDCRQDVLALQVIAMFNNVFTQAGLALYLFPYRVTATAPGCGVIDVVPNATSRDEIGREITNDLFAFFTGKFGATDTPGFARARTNFVQSMAAYSVACYILQIKDRHNGNIMIDGEGHIVHIDFGFLFDIDKPLFCSAALHAHGVLRAHTRVTRCNVLTPRPGGVKFEPNSFKLTQEMVTVMGGRDSAGYRAFTELTVKAFLAIRPHAEQLVDTVHLMLGTGLPSFKGEPTIRRLRDRFMLGFTERQAADYMLGVIRNAHENPRSNVYDRFQKMQNGIPY